MPRSALLVFALAGFLIGCGSKDGKSVLEGSWSVVSIDEFGTSLPAEVVKGARITFAGNGVSIGMPVPELTVHQGKQAAMMRINEFKGTFEVRPEKSPKEIDFVVTGANDSKPAKGIGIYSLDGDTLNLCITDAAQQRPTKFESTKASETKLFKLERAKP